MSDREVDQSESRAKLKQLLDVKGASERRRELAGSLRKKKHAYALTNRRQSSRISTIVSSIRNQSSADARAHVLIDNETGEALASLDRIAKIYTKFVSEQFNGDTVKEEFVKELRRCTRTLRHYISSPNYGYSIEQVFSAIAPLTAPSVLVALARLFVDDALASTFNDQYTDMTSEAAWIVNNAITVSAEYARALASQDGVIQRTVELLVDKTRSDDLHDHCVCIIGNFSCVGPLLRDSFLVTGGIEVLSARLEKLVYERQARTDNASHEPSSVMNVDGSGEAPDTGQKKSLYQTMLDRNTNKAALEDEERRRRESNVVWALSSMCRTEPLATLTDDQHKLLVSIMSALAIHPNNKELAIDALWSLSVLAQGSDARTALVCASGAVPQIVEQLSTSPADDDNVHVPAIRLLGSLCSNDIEQTSYVCSLPRLEDTLIKLIGSQSMNVRKETCWALSNITASTPEHIQAIIESGLWQMLVERTLEDAFDVRIEAAWALCNALRCASDRQIVEELVDVDLFHSLAAILRDARFHKQSIETIFHSLARLLELDELSDGQHNIVEYCAVASIVEIIDQLIYVKDERIAQLAQAMHNAYFARIDEQTFEVSNVRHALDAIDDQEEEQEFTF